MLQYAVFRQNLITAFAIIARDWELDLEQG